MNPEPSAADRDARARTDAFFAGALPHREREPLFAHLRGCGACRAYFDSVRSVYRGLGKPGRGLARHEADLVEQLLLDELAPAPLPWWRRARVLGLPVLALATVGAALLVVRAPPADVFRSRGGGTARALQPIQALCLTRGDAGIDVRPLPDPSGKNTCPVGSYLMVATAGIPTAPQLAVRIIDADGTIRLRAQLSHPKPREIFDGNVPLTRAGAVKVMAIRSDARLTDDALDAAAQSGSAPSHAELATLEIEVTP